MFPRAFWLISGSLVAVAVGVVYWSSTVRVPERQALCAHIGAIYTEQGASVCQKPDGSLWAIPHDK